MAAATRSLWDTPGWARRGLLALHVLVVGCACLAFDRTSTWTWELGGATWMLFDIHEAKRNLEINPQMATELDLSDESIAEWRQWGWYFRFWQRAWAAAAYATALASLSLLAKRRDLPAVAVCLICLYLAYQSFWLTGIRF
jgi:hypothetical protein